MKTIIVDDELHCIEILERHIKKYCPEVEIVARCQSGQEGIETIKSLKPDLVFLDIEMPQMNGFEMLAQIKDYQFDVIFTTAYDKFAVKAFKISAIDYLLKPIDPEDLKIAMKKAVTNRQKISRDQMEILFHAFKNTKAKPKRIALTASDHLLFIETENIVYCESDSNYTIFFLLSGEKVIISKTLKEVEETLEGHDFFRVHASYLVNLKHITKYTRGDGGYIIMTNNKHITISRKNKDHFFELFAKL